MINLIKNQEAKVPVDLRKVLSSDPRILKAWKDITPVSRRDFIRWIESAKQPETRKRRIEVARSKLATGDRRPCCYAVVPMSLYRALDIDPKAKATWKSLTPNGKRDFVDFIDEAKDKEDTALRITKVCIALSKGKNKISG